MSSDTIPMWLWRLTLIALLGASLSVVILLILASGGMSNPKPIGVLAVHDELERDVGWTLRVGNGLSEANAEIGGGSYRVVVPASRARVLALAPYPVQPPCTIMIAGRQVDGPTDAGYGLWWGDQAHGDYHAAAVNGDGYLTVFWSVNRRIQAIKEWQMFPRIHPQGEVNTLQVDIDAEQMLIRANDEIVTTLDWTSNGSLETGFYVETLSAGGTTVDFDWLAIWQELVSQP
jgi:hypothetical protein